MDTAPPIGSKVEALGLVMQSQLNGQVGEVINHQVPPNGNGLVYSVVQFPGQQPMALKPQNLKPCAVKFHVGDTVEAYGLQSNAYLNGLKGKVVNVSESNGVSVYTVDFPSPHGLVAIKAANARVPTKFELSDFPIGSHVMAKDMDPPTLNGKVGTVVSVHPPEYLKVQFPAPHEAAMMALRNCQIPQKSQEAKATSQQTAADFPVGVEAEAVGLKHKTEMNGAKGQVIGHRQPRPDEPTQIIVKFQAFGKVALFPTNLRPLSKPASANPGSPARSSLTQYPVGSRVTVHGLQHNTSLNGQCGTVQAHHEATSQLHVKFDNPSLGGVVAVGVGNVAKAPGGDPVPAASPGNSPSGQRSTASSTAETDSHLQKLLTEFRPPTLPIIAQEGFLNKKTPAVGRDIDRRWFTLRGRMLIYYEEKGRIPLTSSHRVVQTGDYLALDGPNMQRKYELKGDTFSQTTQWLTALKNATSDDKQVNRPLQGSAQQLMALESCVRYRIMRDWSQYLPRKFMEVQPQQQNARIKTLDDELSVARLQMRDAQNLQHERAAEAQRAQGELQAKTAEVEELKGKLAAAEERATASSTADQRVRDLEAELARTKQQHEATVRALEEQLAAARRAPPAPVAAAPQPVLASPVSSPVGYDAQPAFQVAGSPTTVQPHYAAPARSFFDTSPSHQPFLEDPYSAGGSPAPLIHPVHEEETSAYVSMTDPAQGQGAQPGVFLLAD